MTIDEFFDYFEANPWRGPGTPSLDIERVKRGYRVSCLGGFSWGDTVEDAIQAAFDHALYRPSRHAAIQQPFFEDRGGPEPIRYDYRTTDWTPGMGREK